MDLFETSLWPARWNCGQWSSQLGWLHIISDLMIFAAYAAIPILLLYFLRRRPDTPFPKVFMLFCLFVLACGVGHLIEAFMFWQPVYRLSGVSKAITAIVSWVTVAALAPAIPEALKFPGLAKINEQLKNEIENRKAVEANRAQIHTLLRESEERFALALAGASEGVWDWDLETDVVYYSSGFLTILEGGPSGPKRDSIAYWKERIYPLDRKAVDDALQEHIAGKTQQLETEHRIKLPNGDRRWVLVRGLVVRNENGDPVRMVGGLTDVHRIKTAHENLMSHVSHELRTPLAVMHQFASNLKRSVHGELTEDQDAAVAVIQRNATEMGQLIDRVVEAARLSDGRFRIEARPCNLDEVLEGALTSIGEKVRHSGFTIESDVADDIPIVLADPQAIRQVLTNLVDNALKFCPEGSHVQIAVMRSGDSHVEFSVTDNGPGIPPADCEIIFDRLQQGTVENKNSRKGLGLGLYIVREIMRQHDGEVTVKSTVGKGTTFRCTVPTLNLPALAKPAIDGAHMDVVPLSALALVVSPSDTDFMVDVDDPEFRQGVQTIRDAIMPDRDVLLPVWCSPHERKALMVLLLPTKRNGCEAVIARLTRRLDTVWPADVCSREWKYLDTCSHGEINDLISKLSDAFQGSDPVASIEALELVEGGSHA